ncbi:type II toxin-antitoxin system RelE/ParE family toxin [Aquibium microcysteis]|jgi:plasmid stabilization system protein ParE|uniref:type II toxin-antitoxin system RelE/ParE family toxin n=1 Tax=Aquibium microcysteis TaxID=675281 RepID=UPI00165D0B06|nr:type II toxin-antitoxin system RelE/ParE family toxin [Aquibium microcysteis]
MKLVFLASTKPDLEWFRTYYEKIFPEGAGAARRQYVKAIDNIVFNPYIGRQVGMEGLRKFPVRKTPFAIVYEVFDDRVEIIRIWDQRADPELLELHEEAAVLE